jgi:hypothetical protein
MATITAQVGRQVALDQIRVPENVRTLDEAHVQALAGSIKLQGILVPLVVRDDGDVFELVAGFHRVAAAKSVGLAEVPVVVREAQTEDADRAVENITSCRRRHDVIYADRVVIPMSELTCATVRREPAGEVGIRTRTDPGSRLRHTIWLKWRLPLDSESEHAIRTRRHARDSSLATVRDDAPSLSPLLLLICARPQRQLAVAVARGRGGWCGWGARGRPALSRSAIRGGSGSAT